MSKLDVGCWDRCPEGYLGLDIRDFGQEYVQDMRDPLPVPKDGKWEQIRVHHALEHLTPKEAMDFINGCHDICDELYIIVPSIQRESAYYLTHKSWYTLASFLYFERSDKIENKSWKVKAVLNNRGDIHAWMTPLFK